MRRISPVELLDQLRDTVMTLAMNASLQESRLKERSLPIDEMALELDDAVPAWFGRLRAHRLISPETEEALIALSAALKEMSGSVHAELWTFQALYLAPEWQTIRDLASSVLRALREPIPPTTSVG